MLQQKVQTMETRRTSWPASLSCPFCPLLSPFIFSHWASTGHLSHSAFLDLLEPTANKTPMVTHPLIPLISPATRRGSPWLAVAGHSDVAVHSVPPFPFVHCVRVFVSRQGDKDRVDMVCSYIHFPRLLTATISGVSFIPSGVLEVRQADAYPLSQSWVAQQVEIFPANISCHSRPSNLSIAVQSLIKHRWWLTLQWLEIQDKKEPVSLSQTFTCTPWPNSTHFYLAPYLYTRGNTCSGPFGPYLVGNVPDAWPLNYISEIRIKGVEWTNYRGNKIFLPAGYYFQRRCPNIVTHLEHIAAFLFVDFTFQAYGIRHIPHRNSQPAEQSQNSSGNTSWRNEHLSVVFQDNLW